jgi:hypothetical protein
VHRFRYSDRGGTLAWRSAAGSIRIGATNAPRWFVNTFIRY